MKRMAARALAGLVVVAALVYIGDWGVWRARVAHGGGHGVVQVNQFLSSALKGNKVEYDWMGTAPVACSLSLFPQGGDSACWWVERHKSHWQ